MATHQPAPNQHTRTLTRSTSHEPVKVDARFNMEGTAYHELIEALNRGEIPEWVIRTDSNRSAPDDREEHMEYVETLMTKLVTDSTRYDGFGIHPQGTTTPGPVKTTYYTASPPEDAFDADTIVVKDKCRLSIEMDDNGTITDAYLTITFLPVEPTSPN